MKKKVSLDTAGAVTLVPTGSEYASPISILPILALIPQLKPFEDAAANIEEQAGRAVIDSEDAFQKGSDFMTVCAEQWDQLEDLRKTMKKPIDDYGKFVQAVFVPLQSKFLNSKTLVSTRMQAFQQAEDKKRRDAAALIQKANEEAAAKLAQEAEDRGDTTTAAAILDVATQTPVHVPTTRLGGTNSYGRSTFTAKRWTATVEKPFELLQAIIDGKVSLSVIEWKQAELNKVAASLKVEKTVHGLKVFQTENLQQR